MGSRREYTEVLPLIEAVDDRMKKLVLQEMLKSYLYYRIRSGANILKVYDTKQIPFYVAPPALGKWIRRGAGDTLPDAQSTAAAMGWVSNRYCVVPSGFDMLEMMEQEHDSSMILNKANIRATEVAWALRRTLASALWNGTGGAQPDGIATAIEALTPTSQVAVVTGVDKSLKAWFRNQYIQLTQNFGYLAAGTQLPAGILAALQLIEQCTVGTLVPSDIVTTRVIFNLFKRAMLEMSTAYHLITDRDTAKFGFKNFMFDGSYLAWDPNCPANRIFALHLQENFDADRTGDPRDKTRMDADLEDIGKNEAFELNGSIAIAQHPNISERRIAPRSPYRHLQQTEWIITSMNPAYMRMMDQGVMGDDGGNKISTWS